MKKTILSLSVIGLLLTSCGSSSTEVSSTDSTAVTTTSVTATVDTVATTTSVTATVDTATKSK